MPRSTHVAFRNVPEAEPAWQYYGLDLAIVGGADTLADARALAAEAARFALDEDVEIVPVLEWQAATEDAHAPAVYVRTMKTPDTQWVDRQDFARWLRERIHDDPAMRTTFGDKLSSTGDFVICAVLPTDSVARALAQTSSHGIVHFAMPTESGPVCWLSISGPDAEGLAPGARPLDELGVPGDAPVRELMQRAASCAPEGPATRTLTLT